MCMLQLYGFSTKAERLQEATVDSLLVGKTQLEKKHYYVKSVGSAVKLLCVNELGLLGTAETLRHDEAGNDDITSSLFLEYTLEKDEMLASIAKGIPKNAKYTSKDIQRISKKLLKHWQTWCLERSGKK